MIRCTHSETMAQGAEQRLVAPPPPRPRPVSASHALPFPLPSSDPLASKSRGDPPQVMAPATYRASQAMATPHDKKWAE